VKKLAKIFTCAFKKTFVFLIDNFWPLVRPVGLCRYSVSCSQYAKLMLEQEPLGHALWLITKRVASCHPFCKH